MEKISCAQCQPPCPLGEIPSQETQAFSGTVRSISFLPKQVIFEQGDLQSGCYLICDGVAMLFHRTPEGRRIAVGVVGPGDIVGVGSFLGQERHELSAQAITEIRARYLMRAACERLMQEPSLLTGRLLTAMARQVKSLRRQAQLLASQARVRERLAALLLELGGRFGQRISPNSVRIELKLSCELLGEMLDAHRATVNEELINLEHRGLIERVSRQIVILDETKLRELAQSAF